MVHAEAFSRPLSRNEVVGLIFRLTIFGAVTYFTIKWMVDAIDPTRKQKVEAQKQAEKLMKQIGVKNVKLSEYEMSIAAHLVDPLNMHVTWSDIAGLDDVITDLKDTVILPIKKKHLFENSRLLQPPKGVLLYGPPGCGKTLIAKATAKEAGCRFINLQPSTLTDKWYGESQKLAAAVFSLAIKLQPSIIFIDEIDSFLRNRSSSDHEATAMMKAQFMSLWDGLDTDHSCQVIVMGATNRPQDLDSAIMRRMPTRFHINQPLVCFCMKSLPDSNMALTRHIAPSCPIHDEDEIRPVQQQDLHRAIEKMKKSKDAAFQNVLTHAATRNGMISTEVRPGAILKTLPPVGHSCWIPAHDVEIGPCNHSTSAVPLDLENITQGTYWSWTQVHMFLFMYGCVLFHPPVQRHIIILGPAPQRRCQAVLVQPIIPPYPLQHLQVSTNEPVPTFHHHLEGKSLRLIGELAASFEPCLVIHRNGQYNGNTHVDDSIYGKTHVMHEYQIQGRDNVKHTVQQSVEVYNLQVLLLPHKTFERSGPAFTQNLHPLQIQLENTGNKGCVRHLSFSGPRHVEVWGSHENCPVQIQLLISQPAFLPGLCEKFAQR
ncbi:hypothetical protein A6R68_05023, partial [Neotoma lepida]